MATTDTKFAFTNLEEVREAVAELIDQDRSNGIEHEKEALETSVAEFDAFIRGPHNNSFSGMADLVKARYQKIAGMSDKELAAFVRRNTFGPSVKNTAES